MTVACPFAYPIRVVGVGSPQGDDAVGWEVVWKVQEEREWEAGIEFRSVEGGQRLLDLLDGRGTLIVVDAMMGPAAGAIERLEWPAPRLERLRPGTTHDLRPGEAIQLADAVGLLPPRVVIWAIAGERFDPVSALSSAVATAVPELVKRIIAELIATHPKAEHPARSRQALI
jgi:hydrogenase maturation protease